MKLSLHVLSKPITRIVAIGALLFTTSSFAAGLMAPRGGLPELELREHHVDVIIEDGYALTTVEQVFHNPHGSDLEALYSFPVPEKATVGEFTFWIDGQPVTAEAMPREQARQVYTQEKQAGRATALTEQDSYRTFDIAVSPVRAQDDVRIRLAYLQPAQVDTSIGRYVYPLEDGGVDERRLAFWTYNDAVTDRFSFDLTLRTSVPIEGLRLPKHPGAVITQLDENQWQVSLASADTGTTAEEGAGMTPAGGGVAHRLDTDIVVYWRHAQGQPGSVDLVTHREPGAKRGTFMMTFTPGDDLAPISKGRDWVFVLDFSGSMSGKYQSMIQGVREGLQTLNPQDRFRVFLFNTAASEVTSGYLAATPVNVQHIVTVLEQRQPANGTNLYAALQAGLRALDADRSAAVVLVTDGVANVGRTQKQDFLELLERRDARLFTFVMGNSANRPLLQSMAQVSNGFATSVSNSDDISGKLLEAASRLTHEAFHDVELRIGGIRVADLTPDHIGSLYRGQQLVVFGHYWGDGEARVKLSGKVSGQPRLYETRFEFPASAGQHPELERLWAFASIEALQERRDYLGEDADIRQAITDLAVEHGLVTEYTSLIVVREERFDELGIERDNKRRVAKEHQAQEARKNQPTQSRRVDNAQPMYSGNAPSHGGGGGAFGPWLLPALLPVLWWRRRR